jgi:uncharacterized protein YndB with AHSA1/START domain
MAEPGDAARVTISVAVDPRVAFEVFTREVDLWWRKGPRFRPSGSTVGVLTFEPGVGGRLFETVGERVIVAGTITVWEPAARLAFEWRNTNFAPAEKTFVDIRFEPSSNGTRVTVEHRGFAALPPEHPARHGNQGAAMSRMMGMWWSDLLRGYVDRSS